mmetsp:Transcript_1754/g.3173  ORF Transcript_1754/g.3173 Transcript_1754/m.3173 type:complete len:224 (+) Transcript_1754:320-991(+)
MKSSRHWQHHARLQIDDQFLLSLLFTGVNGKLVSIDAVYDMIAVGVRVVFFAGLEVHFHNHPLAILSESFVGATIGLLRGDVIFWSLSGLVGHFNEEDLDLSLSNIRNLMNTGRHDHTRPGMHLHLLCFSSREWRTSDADFAARENVHVVGGVVVGGIRLSWLHRHQDQFAAERTAAFRGDVLVDARTGVTAADSFSFFHSSDPCFSRFGWRMLTLCAAWMCV